MEGVEGMAQTKENSPREKTKGNGGQAQQTSI